MHTYQRKTLRRQYKRCAVLLHLLYYSSLMILWLFPQCYFEVTCWCYYFPRFRPHVSKNWSVWNICNVWDCMCLRSCTVIYHEMRTLFWLMFWKIVNHQQCRSKLVALQKGSLLSCHHIHHTLRDSRGFSLSFKHAHDSILLTPKKNTIAHRLSPSYQKKKNITIFCSFFCSS